MEEVAAMRLLPIITLLVTLFWPFAAVGQRNCYPAEVLENYLKLRFQESPVSMGLSNKVPTTIIEVWVSSEGTWSVVERDHHRQLCMLRAGENWRPVTTERGQSL